MFASNWSGWVVGIYSRQRVTATKINSAKASDGRDWKGGRKTRKVAYQRIRSRLEPGFVHVRPCMENGGAEPLRDRRHRRRHAANWRAASMEGITCVAKFPRGAHPPDRERGHAGNAGLLPELASVFHRAGGRRRRNTGYTRVNQENAVPRQRQGDHLGESGGLLVEDFQPMKNMRRFSAFTSSAHSPRK